MDINLQAFMEVKVSQTMNRALNFSVAMTFVDMDSRDRSTEPCQITRR
jgi:hypothetical protein